MDSTVRIYKTWRSELANLLLFLVACVVSFVLTRYFEWSVISGELITIGSTQVVLTFPVFWLLPFGALVNVLIRMYDVAYVVDSRGIEAKVGILSLNQRIIRVRYEDIRSVETEQTIIERVLNIGNVEIGTAATSYIEIVFEGVGAPREVQGMIQSERDRRMRAEAENEEVAKPAPQVSNAGV